MNSFQSSYFALISLLGGLLLSGNATALDATIKCKTPFCGMVAAAPKTILTQISPDPLPRVDPGDPQTVTAQWSVALGLRSAYVLCLTANVNQGPMSGDDCVALSDGNATQTNSGYTNFEDTVTLPGSLQRGQGWFYVRTTGLIAPLGQPRATYDSNVLPFEWPLNLPNLSAHSAKASGSSQVYAEVTVRNRTTQNAGAFGTRFEVSVCDALGELDIRDPAEEPQRFICRPTSGAHLTTFQVKGPTQNSLLAGGETVVFTDITGMLPSGPPMLFISVTATVDHDNDVAEDREDDNVDNGGRFISR